MGGGAGHPGRGAARGGAGGAGRGRGFGGAGGGGSAGLRLPGLRALRGREEEPGLDSLRGADSPSRAQVARAGLGLDPTPEEDRGGGCAGSAL